MFINSKNTILPLVKRKKVDDGRVICYNPPIEDIEDIRSDLGIIT